MASIEAGIEVEQKQFTFCQTPYTFADLESKKWKQPEWPEADRIGVYLYCIEYEGKFLVNYVGKAGGKGGFGKRLQTDDRNDCAGRYWQPVDVEAWKQGVRIPLPVPMTPEYRERYKREMRPLIRLLLLPLTSDPLARKVENTLVCHLMDYPAAFQFLANRDHHQRRIPVKFTSGFPPIIGLPAPVPESLLRAVESWKSFFLHAVECWKSSFLTAASTTQLSSPQ